MIHHWNEICTQIETAEGKLQDFIETAGLSATQLKKLQKFIKEWNQVKKMADAFDKFIAPVDPIKVESPFDQDDFRYMWKMWKEYLQEQHQILMRTRMEQASLEFLSDISGNDTDKAINIIRLCMKNRWRAIYDPYQNNKSNTEKPNNDGSDF